MHFRSSPLNKVTWSQDHLAGNLICHAALFDHVNEEQHNSQIADCAIYESIVKTQAVLSFLLAWTIVIGCEMFRR